MNSLLKTKAVVLEKPEEILLRDIELMPASENDIIVEIEWSGISTGTEKLLWTGQMPSFPGMGYPLVPGYESVGRVIQADAQQRYMATNGGRLRTAALPREVFLGKRSL